MTADPDFPVGEYPPSMGVFERYGPPGQRSGVDAVLGAADRITAAQAALDDIRALATLARDSCSNSETRTLAVNVLAIIDGHGTA